MRSLILFIILGAVSFGGYSYATRKPACEIVGYRAVESDAERVMLEMVQTGFQLAAICAQFHEREPDGDNFTAFFLAHKSDAVFPRAKIYSFSELSPYHGLYLSNGDQVGKLRYGMGLVAQISPFEQRFAVALGK